MLKFKDKSLKYNKGNFNAVIKLSEDTLHEISWWKKNIFKVFKPIRYPGAWLPDEKLVHINVLERKAVLLVFICENKS